MDNVQNCDSYINNDIISWTFSNTKHTVYAYLVLVKLTKKNILPSPELKVPLVSSKTLRLHLGATMSYVPCHRIVRVRRLLMP
jgi:hypothetical protein